MRDLLKKYKTFLDDKFVAYTSIFSLLLGLLYIWKGFSYGFNIWNWIIISIDFLYIPAALIFKKKIFPVFYLTYAIFIVFVIAFNKTFLYNNFSALFMICIVVLLFPKSAVPSFILYFLACCIVFAINEESLCHFLIHIVRSIWYISILLYTINNRYERKKLILNQDEKNILEQLSNGKVYQKEVEGFSENTIYRKLKKARERNGNLTRDELLSLYQQMKSSEESKQNNEK